MLVLTRHRDESIMIGADVQVIVLEIRGDKVRLGISAPTGTPVDRREVYLAKVADGTLDRPRPA